MTDTVVTAEVLAHAPMEVLGRLRGASNGTFLVRLGEDDDALAVYKPVTGERPLWDFPEGTLSGREVAVYELDRLMGLGLVPTTVWREEGALGAGMCQQWIVESESEAVVDVVAEGEAPDTWKRILRARDDEDRIVELVHADEMRLRDLVLLDAVINNADRKAGHVLVTEDGRIHGIDHGVSLSVEGKLRTVLWGWAGEDLVSVHVAALHDLDTRLAGEVDQVDRWLTGPERRALRMRVDDLLSEGTYPLPSATWPAIPWPVF